MSAANFTQSTVHRPRKVEQTITGIATSDGAGVKLTRVLHGAMQRRLDPFLMLDAFGSDNPDDYIAGFPEHPHRGFETITYMLAGRMRHRDSAGHEGLLESGGVQWMTAGRGVIHSEIPQQKDGVLEGLQLWLNLPAARKMDTPWYRDFPAQEIPEYVTPENVAVRVIAGSSNGVTGAVTREYTEPLYLDIHLPAGATFTTTLSGTHNAFIYVYRGVVKIGDAEIASQRMAVLRNTPDSDGVIVSATKEETRLVLVAGKPLNEPIVQYGPFVMNTRDEIERALSDYSSGNFGA
ncbi:MAG: pirin family protein [Methylobacillus sp.]|jgi:redox-sensitive bicupin YhaK (pirin superfamily)|nr:pirin family protein [Methylobacillus sp.]